ncbi:1,8-cineole 2-endo-monooxygenase [Nymphon striatum]|nr:1,8-cineole 2-endo-monooxygenase [Nymphon striatum]
MTDFDVECASDFGGVEAEAGGELEHAVLAKAPTEVALIIDDLHFGAESVVAVVRQLVTDLPSNGHVVVASRSNDPVASARLISDGHVVTIDAETLAFNAEEVSSICEQHAVSDIEALGAEARWPAQLALALQSDRSTQTRYLAEEIIEQIDPQRRRQLAELSLLGAADDALASRVTGGSVRSVSTLVAGLPLVDRFPDGSVALHDLWVEALRPYVDDDRRAALLAAGSRALIDSGRYVDAMEMSLEANDRVAFRDAARLEAERPTTEFSLSNIRRCIDLLDHTDLTALQQYFRTVEVWSVRGAIGMPQRLTEIAAQAAADGDAHLEALFLYRALQALGDRGGRHDELYERVRALGESNDNQVKLTRWSLDAGDALRRGRIEELLGHLDRRPELVTGDALREDLGVTRELALTMELFVAQASWLRGDASPELALELGAAMGDRTSGRGLATQVVPQIAVFAIVGAAAGDHKYVKGLLDRLDRVDASGLGGHVRSFTHIAPGWAAASIGADEVARTHFERALVGAPLSPWPYRSWMYSLVPAYVLLPEHRSTLDGLDLGPSLRAVLEVARSVVALRESGATQSAAKLRWEHPELLRAHVPVAMLVEACVAGAHAGSSDARKLLADLPDPGTHLLAVATRTKGPVAKLARQLAQSFPKRPAEELQIRFLGPVELERDGERFDPPEWRRSRVQELLAFLVLVVGITSVIAAQRVAVRSQAEDGETAVDTEKAPVTDWKTDFDHSHPDYAANAHAIWDELRAECPVAHSERFGGVWLPTRHDDIAAIAANENEWYTSKGVIVSEIEPDVDAPIGGAPPITSDPPFHAPARRLLLEPFAPRKINALEPFTREFCHGLMDKALAKQADQGWFDAAIDYAQSIPVRVIAEMLGLPPEDGDIFRTFIHNIIENPIERDLPEEETIEWYLDRQIEKHKADPKPEGEGDLIDHLLSVEIFGEPLSEDHVRGTVILLLVAGIDTTWSAIGSSIWHLAQHPDDLRRFRDEPELRPFAIEEFLRAYAPVTMARKVAKDHELRGCPLKEGDWLLLPFPAGNRDPEMFEDADKFIIDRQKNRHGAFGLGIHRCLGSNLARMELAVALEVFVERAADFSLVDPASVRFSTGQIRGPRELPVSVN